MKIKRRSAPLPIKPCFRKKTWRRWLKHSTRCAVCVISGRYHCEIGRVFWRAHVKRWGVPFTDETLTPVKKPKRKITKR